MTQFCGYTKIIQKFTVSFFNFLAVAQHCAQLTRLRLWWAVVILKIRRAGNAMQSHTHIQKITYRTSKRKHARPPRFFVICNICGDEFQAVRNIDGSIHAFSTGARKLPKSQLANKVITLRATDSEYKKLKSTGLTSREVFMRGLEACL